MKQRYFIYFAYNGSRYCGWQIQPNGISVQEVMMKSFYTILRSEIEITAAGRTDAGVHAKEMVAHADLDLTTETLVEFIQRVNSVLPNDIAVNKILPVKSDAHARFDALSRKYEYQIVLGKNVFLNDFAMRIHQPLNLVEMNEAAAALFDYSDFTSFSKLHTDVKTNNCKIKQVSWIQNDDGYVFCIEADRFLRNMVRAIVGTMIEVGKGKISVDEFRKIIEAKNRSSAGMSVPAKGLFLTKITYPEWVFEKI